MRQHCIRLAADCLYCSLVAAGLLATAPVLAQEPLSNSPLQFHVSDDFPAESLFTEDGADSTQVEQASLVILQPSIPLVVPIRPPSEREVTPRTSPRVRRAGLDPAGLGVSASALSSSPIRTLIPTADALDLVSPDPGSLLYKSPAAITTGVQRRNPIINDPRVRGSRVGSMAASGSYWIPARIDLDTMLSKLDSRIVGEFVIVPGPYSVFNGPVLQSVEFDLLTTPRYADGFEFHGSTSVDYLANGQQLYGRQDVWGGSDAGGFRLGYGHRTGNDYESGGGENIPASYNSRDINFSYGRDLSPDSQLEFTYLRLDQTNVELPGQAFDIDYLATDAYEVDYLLQNQNYRDQFAATAWYNRTRLNGSAQRPSKRLQFPFLDEITFDGTTDVDATSTGYRLDVSWFADAGEQLVLGTDFRFVNQELNERTEAGGIFPIIAGWDQTNSPIPDSNWVNTGLFIQYSLPTLGQWQTSFGARTDVVSTQIVDDPAKLASIGTIPATYAEVLGTNVQARTFGLWAAYANTTYVGDDGWSLTLAAGHAERAPSLTELYVAQSFMFLLQNGLNTVNGEPRLAPEQLWQLDVVLAHQGDRFNAQVRGFQSWIHDYITFENIGVLNNPATNAVEQINLKYVNTDLATLSGVEFLGTYEWTDMLTPFANLQYVRGQDQTRNGDFATSQAAPGPNNTVIPSERHPGLPRGSFDSEPNVAGAAKEPLPQIVPLQSRIGLRFHDSGPTPRWMIEISTRLVGPQNRVAVSLLEQPTAGFALGDIRAWWRPTDVWTVLGGIENFTDRNYREHLDFRPQPGAVGLAMFQPGITAYFGLQRVF
jgi:iron complex outermembrane receptor protein